MSPISVQHYSCPNCMGTSISAIANPSTPSRPLPGDGREIIQIGPTNANDSRTGPGRRVVAVETVSSDHQRTNGAVDSAGRLRRQVTFVRGVPIGEQARNGAGHNQHPVLSGDTDASFRSRCCRKVDFAVCFYLLMASFLMSLGVAVVILGNGKHVTITDGKQSKLLGAQIWMIGVVFQICGFILLVKFIRRLFQMGQRRRQIESGTVISSSQQIAAQLPPTYSSALVAKIPSNVVIVENELAPSSTSPNDSNGRPKDTADNDSCYLVTITCDPPPPSYADALRMLHSSSAP